MSYPELMRDLREVENELRLARNRRDHYDTLAELELSRNAMRVVGGLEALQLTLMQRIQDLFHAKT